MNKQQQLQNAVNTAAQFMDFLRKNVGFSDEWPMEIKVAPDFADECNTRLNKFEKEVYALRDDK